MNIGSGGIGRRRGRSGIKATRAWEEWLSHTKPIERRLESFKPSRVTMAT
jgi:hypothetical protein